MVYNFHKIRMQNLTTISIPGSILSTRSIKKTVDFFITVQDNSVVQSSICSVDIKYQLHVINKFLCQLL